MSIEQKKIKVWDIPTRLFHWLTVGLLISLWWTADSGEMEWHQICAYSLMVLVIFRLLWGIVGSETSRFTDFVSGPTKVLNYLTGKHKSTVVGHNPLGGYMVLFMLTVLSLQLFSGLFSSDDIFTEGPLYSTVSSDLGAWFTWLHKVNFNVILACIVLHISVILLYAIKGNNLVTAMISGNKKMTDKEYNMLSQEPKMTSSVLAIIIVAAISLVIGYWLIAPIVAYL
ncbi:cytochrome b/b6 domain-containing protein [Shewanella electrodiphila]|uniref:Cytochrome b/b6 domain-containing protein n=1 Tax=Shewanella electrodiphila TaxID=934143 RepID=A0ABT0KJN7_9GAMM|nr:cytochrome b/b6 domain-containing protein [Shewanella electrodiphila]MCL1044047.1 cytochrome b/b6 domain-containing protein [Shewanella electrodiphila]